MARPTKYTTKMGDEICKRLAEGESLNRICKDEHIADKFPESQVVKKALPKKLFFMPTA